MPTSVAVEECAHNVYTCMLTTCSVHVCLVVNSESVGAELFLYSVVCGDRCPPAVLPVALSSKNGCVYAHVAQLVERSV